MKDQGGEICFDPAKAAVNNGVLPQDSGGGLISGNGTYYSRSTAIDERSLMSDFLTLTGTLAGTLTAEVTNDSKDEDCAGVAVYQTYDKITTNGWAAGVITLVAGAFVGGTNPGGWGAEKPVPWGRFRFKLVITSGTGSIRDKRTSKGA